ncbi:unnamed protein product [Rotaria sp. Silwood2]|nr:unnamed protein product [Rotaria sp. Silwood2]CAF3166209.1 unnamed protein product [Rotaria sp. Silwood2]CAF4457895.1 unnamed protein product [Rotaria sp. Silwood2]CAF4508422.1 unnamed protein product [Rotaria sp. Silwood2]CAF4624714.1 unnamed protein product [Rotaria sp. Silwood2]
MVVDKTLYDVLGVDENATTEEINRAFRRKSLEHHPDRGGSHEMMQQINAAREILTDPKKRDIYDRYGLEGMRSGMGEANFDTSFPGFPGNIFDIFDLFGSGSNRRRRTAPTKGSDIKQVLRVSLEELYSGNTRTISVDRDVVCKDCNGTGSLDGTSRECINCNGHGIETVTFRMGPITQQTQSKCSSCNGEGTMINSKNCCKSCRGKKVIRQTKHLDVDIAPGSHDGETIKFSGEGNQIVHFQKINTYIYIFQLIPTLLVYFFQQLEVILPSKQRVKLNSKEHYEEAEMTECEPKRKKSQQPHFGNGYHHHGAENGEDDDIPSHHQGAQCQTQ